MVVQRKKIHSMVIHGMCRWRAGGCVFHSRVRPALGGGIKLGPGFDDMPGGARGHSVDGKRVRSGKVKIALDAEAERPPVGGQLRDVDGPQFRCAEAQISQAESAFALVLGIQFAQQPSARAGWIEQFDNGHMVGAPLGAIGKQSGALFLGKQFHGTVLLKLDFEQAGSRWMYAGIDQPVGVGLMSLRPGLFRWGFLRRP